MCSRPGDIDCADAGCCLCSLLLTEAQAIPGGVIRSSSTAEGFLWEEGPNSFQPTPAMLKAAVCPAEYSHPLHVHAQDD